MFWSLPLLDLFCLFSSSMRVLYNSLAGCRRNWIVTVLSQRMKRVEITQTNKQTDAPAKCTMSNQWRENEHVIWIKTSLLGLIQHSAQENKGSIVQSRLEKPIKQSLNRNWSGLQKIKILGRISTSKQHRNAWWEKWEMLVRCEFWLTFEHTRCDRTRSSFS